MWLYYCPEGFSCTLLLVSRVFISWLGQVIHCFQFPSLSASIAPGFCYLSSWNPFIQLYCVPAAANTLWKAETSGRKVACPLFCNSILSPPALSISTYQSCFRLCVYSFSQQTLGCLRQLDILNHHKRFGTSWCLPPEKCMFGNSLLEILHRNPCLVSRKMVSWKKSMHTHAAW